MIACRLVMPRPLMLASDPGATSADRNAGWGEASTHAWILAEISDHRRVAQPASNQGSWSPCAGSISYFAPIGDERSTKSVRCRMARRADGIERVRSLQCDDASDGDGMRM